MEWTWRFLTDLASAALRPPLFDYTAAHRVVLWSEYPSELEALWIGLRGAADLLLLHRERETETERERGRDPTDLLLTAPFPSLGYGGGLRIFRDAGIRAYA